MTTHGTFSFPNATTGDVDRFIYDGPVQSSATLPASAGTTRNICHDTNGGNSAGTGPSQGQEGVGGGYLYTETSSPGEANDIYTIEFDTVLDASAEQWQFNYYRLCCGNTTLNECLSTIDVQINENSGGWVTVDTVGGTGDNQSSETDWQSESVDLSESGANTDSSTQVRLRITSIGATQTYYGDVGIDTIEIVGTLLVAKDQKAFRFEDDDGSESGSTFLDTQNTDISRSKENPFRVRVGMQTVGDAAAEAATLQYKETSDTAIEWRDVP